MKSYIPGIVVFLVMLFVPIPALLVDIMYAVAWVFAGIILYLEIRYGENLRSLPRLILYADMWIFNIGVAFTRTIIIGERSILYNYIIGVSFNFIVNIIIALSLMIGTIIFTKKGVVINAEYAHKFALDNMSYLLFDVDMKLSKNVITPEEAQKEKNDIRNDIDFCCLMDGSACFVLGTTKALFLLYFVSVVGGCISGMVYNGQTILEALQQYSFPALLNVIIFIIPIIMLDIAIIKAIRGKVPE